MSRPRWPDSHNSLSGKPGTVQGETSPEMWPADCSAGRQFAPVAKGCVMRVLRTAILAAIFGGMTIGSAQASPITFTDVFNPTDVFFSNQRLWRPGLCGHQWCDRHHECDGEAGVAPHVESHDSPTLQPADRHAGQQHANFSGTGGDREVVAHALNIITRLSGGWGWCSPTPWSHPHR